MNNGAASMFGSDPSPRSQFDGKDWSNNLFSDLGPLLALFGEQVAKQFMSQSTGWADNIVFAMAPLGIITAVTGAIRVGGPTWLKAVIGRARENRAAAEIELMSSTSNEVCELWNGQQIVRIFGAPDVCTLISFPLSHLRNLKPELQGKEPWRLYTLHSEVAAGCLDPVSKRISTRDWIDKHLMALWAKICPRSEQTPGKQKRATPYRRPNAPNITLNLYDISKRSKLYAVAVLGIIIQLGVLVYSTTGTYSPGWTITETRLSHSRYGLPLTVMGTALLVFGMLICAYIVESSTIETSWKLKTLNHGIHVHGPEQEASRDNKGMRLMWVQRCQAVSDQRFESYIIIARDERTKFMSSHRCEDDLNYSLYHSSPNPEPVQISMHNRQVTDGHQLEKNAPNAPSLDTEQLPSRLSETLTVCGTLVSVCGFIAQFTGLRAMHWSVSIAQLLATLIMSGLRLFVRRGLVRSPIHQRIRTHYEADWLATRLVHDEETLWMGPDHGGDKAKSKEFWTEYSYKWGFVSGMNLDMYGPPTGNTLAPVRPEQANSANHASNETADGTSELAITADQVVAVSDHHKNFMRLKAYETVQARVHLGKILGWPSHIHERALCVASAIEIVINRLLESDTKLLKLPWSLRAVGGQMIPVNLSREPASNRWRCDVAEIEAILSLWMFSTVEARDRENCGKETLESMVTERRKNLRLLGPSKTPNSGWILKRWIGGAVQEVTPMPMNSNPSGASSLLRVFKKYRVVGFTGSSDNISHHAMAVGNNSTTDTENLVSDSVAGHVPQGECKFRTRPFQDSIVEDQADEGQAAAAGSSSLLAVFSNVQLDKLFAQDLFSSFMFALAKVIKPIEDDVKIRNLGGPEGTHMHALDHEEAWKLFELESPFLAGIAGEIKQLQGLGSIHDVYVSMIPALSHYNRLPEARCIIDLAQKISRGKTGAGQLTDAAKPLEWLFNTSFLFGNQIEVEATAVLVDFLLSAKAKVKYWESMLYPREHVENLQRVISHLQNLLRKKANKDTLSNLKSVLTVQSEAYDEIPINDEIAPDPCLGPITTLGFLQLHSSVALGNSLEVHQELRKKPGDINRRDVLGWSPLHYAVINGDYYITKLLLNAGADVNICDRKGFTPLHCSVYSSNRIVLIKLLLERGACVDTQGMDGTSPLHAAAAAQNIDAIRLLLDRGSNVNAQDISRRTPLQWAVYLGSTNIVRLLLERDANINPRMEHGRTLLHIAAIRGHADIVRLLLERMKYCDPKDSDRATPLHLAAACWHSAVVEILIENSADTYLVDRYGRTALHRAIKGVNSKGFVREPAHGDLDISRQLGAEHKDHLQAGKTLQFMGEVDMDLSRQRRFNTIQMFLKQTRNTLWKVQDAKGRCPLMLACCLGQPDLVTDLLKAHATVPCKDQALHRQLLLQALSAGILAGHAKVTQVLLTELENLPAFMREISGPVVTALTITEPIDWLLALHQPGITKLLTDRLLRLSDSLKSIWRNSCAPFWSLAALSGTPALVTRVANLTQTNGGLTPLHEAAIAGDVEKLQKCIQQGQCINVTDRYNRTPLHWAAAMGSLPIVKALMKGNADPNLLSLEGLSALDYLPTPDIPPKEQSWVLHEIVEYWKKNNQEQFIQQLNSRREIGEEIARFLFSKGAKRIGSLETRRTKTSPRTIPLDNSDHGIHAKKLVTFNAASVICAIESKRVLLDVILRGESKSGPEILQRSLALAYYCLNDIVNATSGPNNIDVQNCRLNALLSAVFQGDEDLVSRLLEETEFNVLFSTVLQQKEETARGRGVGTADRDRKKRKKTEEHCNDAEFINRILTAAIERGREGIIRLVLDSAGVPPDFKVCSDDSEWTLLQLAVSEGHHSVVRELLEAGAQLQYQLPPKKKFSNTVVRNEVLSEFDDKRGMNALHLAITKGDFHMVELLASHLEPDNGIGVDTPTSTGNRPLHLAVHYARDSLDIIELLLAARATVNATSNEMSYTPLHIAALRSENPADILIKLIDGGGDPELKDANGNTVLHCVVMQFPNYSIEKLNLLLQYPQVRKCLWIQNKDSLVPFELAKRILNDNPNQSGGITRKINILQRDMERYPEYRIDRIERPNESNTPNVSFFPQSLHDTKEPTEITNPQTVLSLSSGEVQIKEPKPTLPLPTHILSEAFHGLSSVHVQAPDVNSKIHSGRRVRVPKSIMPTPVPTRHQTPVSATGESSSDYFSSVGNIGFV